MNLMCNIIIIIIIYDIYIHNPKTELTYDLLNEAY